MYSFTGIDEFEISDETCFICGRKAATKEHLFPKWLQHKFNLWDQKLVLPNKTSIPYRKLTVPCCAKCNGEVYSSLENRISNNQENESDIWRWANKIHFGLTIKDEALEWDRKNPGYKIGDVISPSDPLEQSRHFLHCVSGDFKSDPDPFGSVFKFTFNGNQDYNFIHLINSSSICISLGDRGYVVFVRDGQFIKSDKGIMADYEELSKKDLSMYDMLFFYTKSIEYLERFETTNPVMIMPGKIVKIGNSTVRSEKLVNKELLAAICNHFGFT